MKYYEQYNISQKSERILYFLAKFNSTLDPFYETVNEYEVFTNENEIF